MNSQRKRCRRFNDIGHAHFLTFSCFKRQPFLSKDRSREWMIEAMATARDWHDFHLWAYVIMPEHVHLLLWPAQEVYSLSAILKTIKQSVTRKAISFVQKNAPGFRRQMEDCQPNGNLAHQFWQRGGGFDANLTEPKTIWNAIHYIHANPVRRNLCLRSTEWKWSSAVEMDTPGIGVLPLNLKSLPRREAGQ